MTELKLQFRILISVPIMLELELVHNHKLYVQIVQQIKASNYSSKFNSLIVLCCSTCAPTMNLQLLGWRLRIEDGLSYLNFNSTGLVLRIMILILKTSPNLKIRIPRFNSNPQFHTPVGCYTSSNAINCIKNQEMRHPIMQIKVKNT